MIGTVVNTATVLGGSVIGLAIGRRIPENLKTLLMQTLGLTVLVIGIKMALTGTTPLVTLACLLIGAVIGELLAIEDWLDRLGWRLKRRFAGDSARFVDGFVSATLLFLTGAMTIVGSIQDGVSHDPSTLYLKAMLDGIAAITLASAYGVGVAFSAGMVLIVQGGLTLLAASLGFLQAPDVLSSVTAVGGIVIVAIGINLLELKRVRVGNLIPGILLAIVWPLVF
ncbi:MAG: putative membrane protein YdfK [Deltaproteobacteria bacterium ADurb.Bin510]|nr:MAG: putative membrane protein YdfK [Deltaproteobacteria bacterium ADurb.Bin510]